MQGDYPHWIRLSNDNPENAVGKCRHLAQAMFQFRIELIILDNIRLRNGPLDPCHLNLPLGDTPKSVLRILKVTHLMLLGIQSNAEFSDGRCRARRPRSATESTNTSPFPSPTLRALGELGVLNSPAPRPRARCQIFKSSKFTANSTSQEE